MKPDPQTTDPNEDIGKRLSDALGKYRPMYQSPKEEDGDLTLVDLLTPPWEQTIELGGKEVDNLVDYIISELIDAKILPNPYEVKNAKA